MMKAQIITIGDEILIGQITDTNSAWLSRRLNDAGFTVIRKLTVGDSEQEITRAVRESMAQCDLTVMTGGLGPTRDDRTKAVLAKYFGGGMVRDQWTWERNARVLASRGVDYNDLNQAQSMVPECCRVLRNDNGTAPGMWFERDGRVLIALPGVPFEMKTLMEEEVLPDLMEHFSLKKIVHSTAITFGLAESVLAQKISDWEDALPGWMHLAYLPSASQIRLRLSAYDIEGREEEEEIGRQFTLLERIIPEYVLGYGEATVASVTADILTKRGMTLSVAESCTGGALSAGFTAMPGASEYFLGGVVSYSNDVKAGLLGVRPEILMEHGAVSREVAEQMAVAVRALCGSDWSIATTGIAGPSGGTPLKPVGTVWIAVAGPERVVARKFMLGKLRDQNIERACATAADMLRRELLGLG